MVKAFKKNKQNQKSKKDFKKKKNFDDNEDPNAIEERTNNAEFYLDDADADLADDDDVKDKEENSEMEEDEGSLEGSDLDFGEEDYVESDQEEKKEEKKITKITKEELTRHIKKSKDGSLFSLTRIVIIFGKVTNPNENSDDLDEDNILTNSKVVNRLIKYCIETLPEIFLLKLNSKDSNSTIKTLIKRYLSSLSRYLKTAESSMGNFILSHMKNLTPLILMFNNFVEVFTKLNIKGWANNPSQQTSKECYNFIKELINSKPTYFEFCIKLFYINYLDVAKAMNLNSIGKIKKLQDDIIRILSFDYQKAYLTIFTFVRKLCLQLRATIMDKTFNTIKNIYNWQFINSLILWGKVIVEYYNSNSDINLLAYPLIQTIIGVIRLNLVDTFYPLRMRLVNLLNEISRSTGIFIPVSFYLFEILESNHFKEHFKIKEEDKASFSLSVNLKVKKEEYNKYSVCQRVLDECLDSLMEYMGLISHMVAYPEMASMIITHLRKVLKQITVI